eukprot:SAG31_NODE_13289_length_879_cov_1.551282_2_plen_131_part_01
MNAKSATGLDLRPQAVAIELSVGGAVMDDHGDSEPAKLSRLRWLDSTEGHDDRPSAGFDDLRLSKAGDKAVQLIANDKAVVLDTLTGLPASIRVGHQEILAKPITFSVDPFTWWCPDDASAAGGFRWTKQE